jgi:hypothetical protein
MTATFSFGSATSQVSIREGVTTSVLYGVVRAAAVLPMAAGTWGLSFDKGCEGAVTRLDRSVQAYGIADLLGLAKLPPWTRDIPNAFVVAECNLPMFSEHCRRAGAAGLIRRAFSDPLRAEQWVREEASLLAATMIYRSGPTRP